MQPSETFEYLASVVPASTLRTVRRAARPGGRLLMVGPPGMGSTMIARRIPQLLPPLDHHQRRWSVIERRGTGGGGDLTPPFRAPHHSCSPVALAGDERTPGEVRLARFGVLYLDELPEFSAAAIQALTAELDAMGPTAPMVVAYAHACLCGRGTPIADGGAICTTCSPKAIARHWMRLEHWALALRMGPLDRVRIHPVTLYDLRRAR